MLRKTACVVIAVPSLMLAGTVNAASSISPTITAAHRSLSFSLGGMRQNYREVIGGTVADKENGTIVPTYGLGYSVMGKEIPFLFSAKLAYTKGDDDYHGALMDGTPYNSTTGNKISSLDFNVGYAFGSGRFAFIPSIEYGYNEWIRDLDKGGAHGYTETYRHQHAALDFAANVVVTPRTVFSIDGAYGSTVNPKMDTGGVGYGLGSKPWMHAGVGLDYAVMPEMHLSANVSGTWYKYGESSIRSDTSYEPYSKTRHVNLNFGVSYNY